MVESISCKELYEKLHELYVALIRHIICSITLTGADGKAVDTEMLQRVQECCLTMFDELNYSRYQQMLHDIAGIELDKLDLTARLMGGLTYSLSSMADHELLPAIKEKYKDMLTEEEFNMLDKLFGIVSERLSTFLSLSCKCLKITNDLKYL